MEEEKQNFGRLMKDARRRFDEFLSNLERNKPFSFRRIDRELSKGCNASMANEQSGKLYRRLSIRSENSDEDLKVAKMMKVRSFNRHTKITNRLRHSVIGNGKEFCDLEEMLLIETNVYRACQDDNDDSRAELSAEDALTKYIKNLYTKDIETKEENKWPAEKLDATGSKLKYATCKKVANGRDYSARDADVTAKTYFRKSLSCEFQRTKTRRHRRSSSSYAMKSRLASADKPNYSVETNKFLGWHSTSCTELTAEQKRRAKEKMKQALKRPHNYLYLGNL